MCGLGINVDLYTPIQEPSVLMFTSILLYEWIVGLLNGLFQCCITIRIVSVRRWKNNSSSGRHGMESHMETLRLVLELYNIIGFWWG